ncbi:adenylyl-sulfate kinase, partial [Klebsiella pneumoniae]|uniref:adenylyl-sulfate kinase n=1 Tax=Klebsiella pneumoniae TaxID=573 RepID=UPI00385247BD
IFGQPCAGKSTLAKKLHLSNTSVTIDGDELRAIFKDRDFSTTGRRANMLRAMNIALYENHRNDLVFCSLLCPFNDQRMWLD